MAPVSTCEFIGPTLIVYPSGAARATRPKLIVPAAPLTFSIITGCPSEPCILAAMIRASVSVGPPRERQYHCYRTRWVGFAGCWPSSIQAAADDDHNRQKSPPADPI